MSGKCPTCDTRGKCHLILLGQVTSPEETFLGGNCQLFSSFVSAHLLEVLELLVPGEPLLLAHPPVDGYGREVLLDQQLGQCHTPLDTLHKDDHLEMRTKCEKDVT